MPARRPDPAKAAAAIAPLLRKKALDVLQDPRVQQQILELGPLAIDAAKRLGPSIGDRVEKVGGRFGQKGLERRASNLQAVVSELVSEAPALAANLEPLTESLAEVRRMLRVSTNLSFTKRKRAHWEIDDVLDELEAGLLSATRRDAPPDQET